MGNFLSRSELGNFLAMTWGSFTTWDRPFSNQVLHTFPGMLCKERFHQPIPWVNSVVKSLKSEIGQKSTYFSVSLMILCKSWLLLCCTPLILLLDCASYCCFQLNGYCIISEQTIIISTNPWPLPPPFHQSISGIINYFPSVSFFFNSFKKRFLFCCRLRIQYDALQKEEGEQNEFLEQLISQK